MHFGYRNNKTEYNLATEKLQTTAEDTDYYIEQYFMLKLYEWDLRDDKRSFVYKSPQIILQLYKSLV